MARLGATLLVLGVLMLGFGALWQLGLVPGSRVVLPAPLALDRVQPRQAVLPPDRRPEPTILPVQQTLPVQPTVAAAVRVESPTPVAAPTLVLPRLASADADDRQLAVRPESGYAVRLAIPAIKLDTEVKQGGIVVDADGNPSWQTLPFVAVHYGDLTSLIGATGNAVIAGHVVTRAEGNVFRLLYQLDVDDRIQVWDDQEQEHDFHVLDVKLVPPSDTSVMAPTVDQTLTLITCGGSFDPIKREFSDRLVVIAKPLGATR